MIINPDGLFNGDRLALCSNSAHLHWPFFFLASDGFARLELNYLRIVGKAFSRFSPPPTEVEFWQFIQEYHAAGLLFIWMLGAKKWGQWDTDSKYLPRFKTTEDHRSPIPPEPDFTDWVKIARSGSNILKDGHFRNPSVIFPSGGGVGVGVGGGVGAGKRTNLCSVAENATRAIESPLPFDTLDPLPGPTMGNGNGTRHVEREFLEWYGIYFRRIGKGAARKAYWKQRSCHTAEFLIESTKKFGAYYRSIEARFIPHPATFLNREYFVDEPPTPEPKPQAAEDRWLEKQRANQ